MVVIYVACCYESKGQGALGRAARAGRVMASPRRNAMGAGMTSTESEGRLVPPLRRPSVEELISLGDRDYLRLDEREAAELGMVVDELLGVVEELTALWADRSGEAPAQSRWSGRRPAEAENPWNAFVWFCDVAGAPDGPLSDRLVGVEGHLHVAPIPPTNRAAL